MSRRKDRAGGIAGLKRFRAVAVALVLQAAASTGAPAQSGQDAVARLDAAAGANIGLVSSNAYAKFSGQSIYRQGPFLCAKSRQDRPPAFQHYACVMLADLDPGSVAVAAEQVNVGRGEISFGLRAACAARPCVREAVMYDAGHLAALYRLATHWTLACRSRCEAMIDEVRRLVRAAQGPGRGDQPPAPRLAEAMATIEREAGQRWPSEPPPPYLRPRPDETPSLPFKALSIFPTALCSALKGDDPPVVAYRCAEAGAVDARRLRRSGDEIEIVCRGDAACASGFSLDLRTGEVKDLGSRVASSFYLPCGKVAPLLPYAPCDTVEKLLPFYLRLASSPPE